MKEEFKFRQNISEEIFKRKYCLHGESTPEEVFQGVAEEIALAEKPELRQTWQKVFYDSMVTGEFIPAGRILANARPNSPMKNYNNCFTIDIEDSMDGITTSLKEYMTIQSVGGGVGFNGSKLRPKDFKISKGGESSGPISFAEIFDAASKTIKVGGQRRAASIFILNDNHPDLIDFINVKRGEENNKLSQFNISVGVTDKFMEAVKNDEMWQFSFEGKQAYEISAKEIYNQLCKNAWWYNEPGTLFLDTIERYNNAPHKIKVDRCNPCGEIVMPPYSLCCLSSINLSKLVLNPFTSSASFNFERFDELVKVGVRFLDNVLDRTEYPLEKIEKFSKKWRRIGLGITGLANAMMMLGIRYGSEESVKFVEEVGTDLSFGSYHYSADLAKEKGAFPECDEEIGKHGFLKNLIELNDVGNLGDKIKKHGLRNIGLNTIAPNGTISFSIGQNCSSGIEPVFALEYDRTIIQDDDTRKTETVYDNGYLEYVEKYGKSDTIPHYMVTSHQIPIKESIDVQAAFQKHIDHSISKTINMPFETSLDEYKGIFMYAWEKGLKGVTSFHEGAGMAGILSTKVGEDSNIIKRYTKKRPDMLECDIHEIQVDKKRVIALVGLDNENNEPYEIFITDDPDHMINVKHAKKGTIKKIKINKTESIYNLEIEGKRGKFVIEDLASIFDDEWGTLGRMTSMALRHEIPLQFIVSQYNKTKKFGTFMKGISRVLKKYIKEGEASLESLKCPECGSETLEYREGCLTCTTCGNSKCG